MFYFLFFICFGFSLDLAKPLPLFSIDNKTWYTSNFYEEVFKEDWVGLSVEKKEEVFQDFLSMEAVCYVATQQGFNIFPEIKKELDLRRAALLINNTYEHLIARPLIKQEDLLINKKYLKYKSHIYHLLVGFSGSEQETGALLSKKEAFRLADSLRVAINKEVSNGFNVGDVFSRFALEFSADPSAQKNKGVLGWVPWGQTVMSFQKPLFELDTNLVSSPILTEYGYHLALKTGVVFSNYYYYTPQHYIDLTYKVSQGFLPVDSLRFLASEFDSLLIKKSGLKFNHQHLDSLIFFINKKQEKEKLLGNKNVLISWLEEFVFREALFLSNKKGFGVLWLVNKLKQTPSSRIPSIKNKEDLRSLILSFILKEEVLVVAKEQKIDTTASFLRDWSNNYKNIIYSEYLSFLNSSVASIDSSLVLLKYKEGLYNNKYIKPKRVVFQEVRVFSDSLGLVLEKKVKEGVSFDSLSFEFGGAIREPVSSGVKSPLGKALFSLNIGEVSPVIKNNDGSFSLARVESFLPEEPFSLERVFSQLEQEIRREKQDSVRKNLFKNITKDLSFNINYSALGLKND